MTCPKFSDQELLDRCEADIRSTMAALMRRVSAEFGDLSSLPRSVKTVAVESVTKDFTDYTDTLVSEVIEYTRKRLPEDWEIKADRLDAIADAKREIRAAE